MKIDIKQVSDEETNNNLEIEQEIENAYKKESIFKTIWIIVIVFSLLYWIAIEKPNLEDIRQEQIRTAKDYIKINWDNEDKYLKIASIYKLRKENWKKCLDSNSQTWIIFDCSTLIPKK